MNVGKLRRHNAMRTAQRTMAEEATMSKSTTRDPRSTKKFQAIVAVLGEDLAVKAWNEVHPDRPIEVPLTAKEQVDAAIADAGFVPVRGRVYGDGSLLEAGARVLKSGNTEIVHTPGDHRIKAVCVFVTESGSLAFQNLGDIPA